MIAATVLAAVSGPALAAFAAGTGTVTTGAAAEGWYRAGQTCTLPVGCPPTPPSPYPADTLHVGVLAGQEEARTVLQLDLSALPAGTKPAGGQLRLPVDAAPADGARAPETAALRACLVTEPVKDAAGAVAAGPKVDCDAASAPAMYVAASGQQPAMFTVDLGVLAAAWQDGAAPGALALLPATTVAPPASWHVTFSGRKRTGSSVPPVSALVTYVGGAVDVQQLPPPAPVAQPDAGFAPAPPVGGDSFAAPAMSGGGDVPPLAAPAAAPPAALPPAAAPPVQPVASVVQAGFRYPAVFLLPLVLLFAVGWVGRALTRDLAGDTP